MHGFLILQNGVSFEGTLFGSKTVAYGEMIFNTSMYGYQEVISDPSYLGQIVTFTASHIGNTGVNSEDEQSFGLGASGIVTKTMPTKPNSWRSEDSLNDYLIKKQVAGIAEIDTRYLTSVLRDEGCQYACIGPASIGKGNLREKLKKWIMYRDSSFFCNIGTSDLYFYRAKTKKMDNPRKGRVVVYDYGVKLSILENLSNFFLDVIVINRFTLLKKVFDLKADAIVLSNGPGDPRKLFDEINIVKSLITRLNIPILGICLGHQIIALAAGAKVKKIKYGHHGTNHPVFDYDNNKTYISSQNHNFAVDENSLTHNIEVTQISLLDETIQGIRIKKNIWGFQFHPEASPGTKDAIDLFKLFHEFSIQKKVRIL